MEIDRPITIGIVFFIFLALLFYLLLPKYGQFQSLLTKLGEKEAELKGKSAYYVEVTNTYKELMQYEDNLKKIDTALPEKFSIALLVSMLYKKSIETGVIIQRINTTGIASVGGNTGVKETTLIINLVGSYDSFKRFISALEKSSRIFEGERFSFAVIAPSVNNPTPPQSFPINLELKVYSY